jgi:hypothetical protein
VHKAHIKPKGGTDPTSILRRIMTYAARKTARFLPSEPRDRYEVAQWVAWQLAIRAPNSANRPFPASSKTVAAVQRDNRARTGWIFSHNRRVDQGPPGLRIRDLAQARVRYGYFRILLRRNHRRVYRIYREEGLSLRLARPRPPSRRSVTIFARGSRDRNIVAALPIRQASPQVPKLQIQAVRCDVPPA